MRSRTEAETARYKRYLKWKKTVAVGTTCKEDLEKFSRYSYLFNETRKTLKQIEWPSKERDIEIYVRHKMGESMRQLGRDMGLTVTSIELGYHQVDICRKYTKSKTWQYLFWADSDLRRARLAYKVLEDAEIATDEDFLEFALNPQRSSFYAISNLPGCGPRLRSVILLAVKRARDEN